MVNVFEVCSLHIDVVLKRGVWPSVQRLYQRSASKLQKSSDIFNKVARTCNKAEKLRMKEIYKEMS